MNRLVFAVLCFSTFALVYGEVENEVITSNVQVVQDIDAFKRANPDVNLVPLERSVGRGQIRYSAGQRVSGDKLVAQDSDSETYSSPQDIILTLQYPASGQGSIVTFVDVIVNQVSVTSFANFFRN